MTSWIKHPRLGSSERHLQYGHCGDGTEGESGNRELRGSGIGLAFFFWRAGW